MDRGEGAAAKAAVLKSFKIFYKRLRLTLSAFFVAQLPFKRMSGLHRTYTVSALEFVTGLDYNTVKEMNIRKILKLQVWMSLLRFEE